MKLIDADALKKEVDNFPNCYNGWSDTYDKAYIIGAIEEQPSIDIVRCQDCKHWVYNFNGCARNPCTEPWYATDFCNYGEREGE